MQAIEVVGLASKTSKFIKLELSELDENLLLWLRRHQVTIASSCDGEGVCKKCVIQNEWLSCAFTVKSFLDANPEGKIFISYL